MQPRTMAGTVAEETLRRQVADLTARVAAQEATLAVLRAAPRRRTRCLALRRRAATVTFALLVALVPLALFAANPFTDLNPGSVHNADIDAIYNAGVTSGCDPGVAYCPNDYVTRQEMA